MALENKPLDWFDKLPKQGKVSPAACLGKRVTRPLCPCCGGASGIRAAFRKNKNKQK